MSQRYRKVLLLATGALLSAVCNAEVLDQKRAALALQQYEQGLASAPMRESHEAERYKWTVGARIFGGVEVPKNSRPWQVALLRSWTDSNLKAQFCGGSYVGGNVVVTAAHCVDKGTKKESVDVLLGTSELSTVGRRFKVTSIDLEDRYNANAKNFDHDIALLTLDIDAAKLAQLGTAVRAIDLITATQEPKYLVPGQYVAATGWGRTEDGALVVAKLREVSVPITYYDVCNDVSGYNYALTKSMICAGEYSGGADTCTGDSGGPLTIEIGSSRILAGVTSAGAQGNCGQPGFYGVYTRVAPYRDWIRAAVTAKKK